MLGRSGLAGEEVVMDRTGIVLKRAAAALFAVGFIQSLLIPIGSGLLAGVCLSACLGLAFSASMVLFIMVLDPWIKKEKPDMISSGFFWDCMIAVQPYTLGMMSGAFIGHSFIY